MPGLLRRVRRTAGTFRRWLLPTPEVAAWKHAWHLAETTPRFTPGTIRMMDYELRYSDLMTICPQWRDIFVTRSLDFVSVSSAPRILDCGANVGLASLFFKRRYPRARITAYEADPALFAILDGNLTANGAGDIERVHAALWTSSGRLAFRCDGGDSGMIASLRGAVTGEPRTVPSLRLRDILAAEPIDLLKLDIEGAEDAVLADCEPVLDRVRTVVLDLHELDPAVRQAPRVLECLTRAGFTYAVDEFVAHSWRTPVAGPESPFPGKAMIWSMSVHAWRPGR
jgi:FkbM family methyltransferase